MTSGERRLEAPHRRLEAGPRILEKTVVTVYRTTSWAIGRLPPAVTSAIIGRAAQLSYLLWPTKRRWSNSNFGHVLGLPPDHPRVRRLALSAYREYGRYIVELMRLPHLAPERAAAMVPDLDLTAVLPVWEAAEGGMILAAAHVGNNDAVGAAIAGRKLPITVVADDSAYPDLFDDFRRLRESWGVGVIPWRNLREIYGVLKRGEMLALLIDWGYREDGIPVLLCDSWTTLPAGPAMLAAKTRSPILAIATRRAGPSTFHVSWADPIHVRSSDPADLQRATQAIADTLTENVRAVPSEWYSFKPMWPASVAEQERLAARAAAMLAGSNDPAHGDPAA